MVHKKNIDKTIKVDFNDLPLFCESTRDLLQSDVTIIKNKTKSEVLREFEKEKWGVLRNELSKKKKFDINYVEELYNPLNNSQIFFSKGNFYYSTTEKILKEHLSLYTEMFTKYLDKVSCIVELGAGFGSKILSLASQDEFAHLPIYAAELTNAGQDIIKMVARQMELNVNVGCVDFRTNKISGISIPKKALIFTSYALHYDPNPSKKLFHIFKDLEPFVVLNYEPCYELYNVDTIHGQMCKKYITINDYTKNIYSIIEKECSLNRLKLNVIPNIIGDNPLMPISCLETVFM